MHNTEVRLGLVMYGGVSLALYITPSLIVPSKDSSKREASENTSGTSPNAQSVQN